MCGNNVIEIVPTYVDRPLLKNKYPNLNETVLKYWIWLLNN